jgi:hypothetical protein
MAESNYKTVIQTGRQRSFSTHLIQGIDHINLLRKGMKAMKIQRLWMLSITSLVIVGALGWTVSATVSAKTALSPNLLVQASPEDPAQGQMRKERRRIDFSAAAAQLGTTEAELKEALGVPARPPEGDRPENRPENRPEGSRPARPSFQEAATQLGVSEEQLTQALGLTIDPQTGEPSRPRNRPDLQAAATELGVTKEQLKAALGMPDRPPTEGPQGRRGRLDIAGAATKLGVTEDQLIQALGIPARPAGDRPGDRPGN